MSPSRTQARGYRPPRERREVLVAVFGVVGVLVLTSIAIWLLAPQQNTTNIQSPTVTLPTDTSVTTAPGQVTTTAPSSVTTVPGG